MGLGIYTPQIRRNYCLFHISERSKSNLDIQINIFHNVHFGKLYTYFNYSYHK